MSAVLPPITPKLDLAFVHGESNTGTPGLSTTRERSTIGDLISFSGVRDVGTRQLLTDQRRRSFGDLGKLKPLIKSKSDRSLLGSKTHRENASSPIVVTERPKSERDVLLERNKQERKLAFSPIKNANRLLMSPDKRQSGSPDKKRTRRESMLHALREDLEKIPCLHALNKRHSIQRQESDDYENVFRADGNTESESEDDQSFVMAKNMAKNRRRMSKQRSSRLSSSSLTSDQYRLTEAEVRKLKMIETLNRMNPTPAQRRQSDSEQSELAIIEASFIRGKKRGSIATHVLMKARHKRVPLSERDSTKAAINIRKTSTPHALSDTDDMTEEQKEKTNKFLQVLKSNIETPKLPILNQLSKGNDTIIKEDAAKEALLGFRRKVRRKKFKPLQIFRKKAKFVLLLLRAWKIHSNAINESLIMNNDSLDMMTRGNDADLMFDITQYRASKEAKVSAEAKRILMKKPKERTNDEEHYLQIFLRNYKSIAEYPVKMQKMIAQRSWFESFDSKRVIVREGHVPMCFYFILSGSAVVSTMENGTQKTVMFLNRGDSFGDIAILNKARRQTTVISRDKIELLVMTDEDFEDIFMSGGLRDPDDPFLKSINFLQGWPRSKLIDNPKKCIFSYFKRGTVLVADSNNSDWIFVIKSGSASVLKKLQTVDIKRRRRKKKKQHDFREEMLEVCQTESFLSHEEQIQMLVEEEKRSLEDQGLHVRFYALPEINVETNDSYNELRQMKEEYMNANTMNRALGALEKLADSGVDVQSETGQSDTAVSASVKNHKQNRRKSVSLLKGPFMLKSHGLGRENSFSSVTSRVSRRSSNASVVTFQLPATTLGENKVKVPAKAIVDEIDHQQKVDEWEGMDLPTIAGSPVNDLTIKPPEVKPLFVQVQALTKGQIFGMADLLFENQPNFSLVSNGTECIMIEKKFFMENASQSLVVRLRENTFPYPSNDDLQANLELQMRWDHQKTVTLDNMLRDVQMRKSDPHDSRGFLDLPPIKS